MTDFTEIQAKQEEFVSWLENRPGMINIKNSHGVTRGQTLAILSELFEVLNEVKLHKWWDLTPKDDKKVLEELTDVLSHISNVASQLEVKLVITEDLKQIETLEEQFIRITGHIIQLPFIKKYHAKRKIELIFYEFIQLVYSLEFDAEQLKDAYFEKLEKNYLRFK